MQLNGFRYTATSHCVASLIRLNTSRQLGFPKPRTYRARVICDPNAVRWPARRLDPPGDDARSVDKLLQVAWRRRSIVEILELDAESACECMLEASGAPGLLALLFNYRRRLASDLYMCCLRSLSAGLYNKDRTSYRGGRRWTNQSR